MTEGKETTGGTPPDRGAVQDLTKEETASEEVEPLEEENTHHVLLAAERAQEEDLLVASEKGRVLRGAEIETTETSVDWAILDNGCPTLN